MSASDIYTPKTRGTVAAPDDPISELLPLREPTFFILLSLAQGANHGYAIIKEVAALSGGRINLSTGTLYEALARLLDQGLIERVPAGQDDGSEAPDSQAHPGKTRKAYRLSEWGRRVLAAEAARLQALVAAAQRRLGTELI